MGEVIEDYIERTTIRNQYPVLTSSQQKGIMLQEDYFANRQVTVDENIGYFILPRGYFTYRSRSDNDVFVFNRNDVIDKGIISYFYPVFNVKDVDSDFFLQRINNGIEHQIAIAAEGTGQHVLSLNKFKNISALFPALEEQTAIGNFFRTLDDAITLHKRKLDKLKELKKAYLQKMFPQVGEKVPRVRFAGFTEPWVQRKLGEVVDRVTMQSNAIDLPKIEFEDIISGEGRLNKDILNKFDKRKGIVFEPNNILYGKLRPYLKNWLFTNFKGVALGDFWVLSARNSSPIFDYYLIQTEKYQEAANLSTGTKMPRADWNTVSTTIFSIPKNKLEQDAIGNFFNSLDKQIASMQQKLAQLKQLKAAYLKKMFI